MWGVRGGDMIEELVVHQFGELMSEVLVADWRGLPYS